MEGQPGSETNPRRFETPFQRKVRRQYENGRAAAIALSSIGVGLLGGIAGGVGGLVLGFTAAMGVGIADPFIGMFLILALPALGAIVGAAVVGIGGALLTGMLVGLAYPPMQPAKQVEPSKQKPQITVVPRAMVVPGKSVALGVAGQF
jgi:hypothetical protein